MKINFQSLLDNQVIEPGKITEIFVEGNRIWKGMSDNLIHLDEKYEFIKFNKNISHTFNEAFYKIEVKEKNKILVEEKKTFEKEMDYGLPEDQKYPLYDKAHVLSAIKFFNYCEDPEKQQILAKAIIEKMKKYNISFDVVGDKNQLKQYLPILKEEDESKKVEVLNNLRKDMQGEFDAIIDYDERAKIAKEAGYTELADTLEDIRDEEKVHVGELQTQLKKLDPEFKKGLDDGEKEVQEESSKKLTEEDEIEHPDIEMFDDGDGKGRYFYTDGHRKVYPDDHSLDETMTIANGKGAGMEVTTMNGKPINMKDDYEGHMIQINGHSVVVEPSGRKIHGVGDSATKSTQGRLVKFTPETTINGIKYKGDQVTPTIERYHKLQKKQAEEVKKYIKDHKDDSSVKGEPSEWDKPDIVPSFLKKDNK